MSDPILKILLYNSNLTKIQLETLLIDFLAEKISGRRLKMDEKARLRISKAEISRGAFNRTLKQARRNIVKSIYTILLLGYLGVFESTRLDPFLEVANRLQEYVEAYKNVLKDEESREEYLRVIEILRKELELSLEELTKPRVLSNM